MSTGQFNCQVMGQETIGGCPIAVGNIFCYLVANQEKQLTLLTCNIGKFLNTNQVSYLSKCNYWHAQNFNKQSTEYAPAAAILGARLYFFWVDKASGELFSTHAQTSGNSISYAKTPIQLTYKGGHLSQSCDLAANASPDGSRIILHTFDHSSVTLRAYYFDPANLDQENSTWDTTNVDTIDSAYTTLNLNSDYFHINAVYFTEDLSGDFIAASFYSDKVHQTATLVYRIQADGSPDTSSGTTYFPAGSLTDIHKGFRMAVGTRQKVFGIYCDDNQHLRFRTLFPLETTRPASIKWSEEAGYWNQDQKSTSEVVPALCFLGQSGNIVMYGDGGESNGGYDVQAQGSLNEATQPINQSTDAKLVSNTTTTPFCWVGRVVFSRPGYWDQACTGWLIPHPQSGGCLFVTAAHCLAWNDKNVVGWPTSAEITPAASTSKTSPYQTATVDLTKSPTAMQLRIEWLITNQATIPKYHFKQPYYDYAAIYITPSQASGWDLNGFTPVAVQSMVNDQVGTWTGYPYKSPYNPGDMYTQSIDINQEKSGYFLKFKAHPTIGASGSPIYYQDASGFSAVGLVVSAPRWLRYTSMMRFLTYKIFNSHGVAFQPSAVTDLTTNWTTPLAVSDKITSLKMVIRTGKSSTAGTGNETWVNVLSRNYYLSQGSTSKHKYAMYDLTDAVTGDSISDLSKIAFKIQSSANVYYDNWEIESVAVFVNNRLLNAQNFDAWLKNNNDSVSGFLNP